MLHCHRMRLWRRSISTQEIIDNASSTTSRLMSCFATQWNHLLKHRTTAAQTEWPQWLDPSLNMRVRVSQVRPSNCFRRLEKNSSTFRFWHKSFFRDDVKLAELSNNSFEWKMWHFSGVKHTLTAPTYFQGVRTVQSPRPTPLSLFTAS